MAKPVPKNQVLSPAGRMHEITQELVAKGHTITYVRKALYPVLEAKTLLRERSRDQIGDVEKFTLRLLAEEVSFEDDVARLLGFKVTKIGPILKELEGRGLIEGGPVRHYTLTELGRLSHEQGAAVFEVERSLLLCGLSGRLLPRELYNIPRMATSQLPRAVFGREFLEGAPEIALSELSLSRIKDKRKVNLPDEAVEILGVVGTSPSFMEGILVIYFDTEGNQRAELHFGRASVDWLQPKQVLPIVEPLGYSVGKSAEQVKEMIAAELLELGAVVSGAITVDHLQNVRAGIRAINGNFAGYRYENNSLALYLGTSKHKPVPIGCFPFPQKKNATASSVSPKKVDILYGRTLSLIAEGADLAKTIDVMRVCHDIVREFARLSVVEKKKTRQRDFLLARLSEKGIEAAEVIRCLDVVPDAKLAQLLTPSPETRDEEVA